MASQVVEVVMGHTDDPAPLIGDGWSASAPQRADLLAAITDNGQVEGILLILLKLGAFGPAAAIFLHF